MKLKDFKVEQWMNDYEHEAIYNMTDTCVKALTFQELMALEDVDLNSITLDYGHITGDARLKEEILSLYDTGSIENITTTQGCLQANELVMNTLLEPGDEVIACVPGYQQFYDLPKSIGCKVHLVHLREENGWLPALEDFSNVLSEKTKMVIINNPANPTGVDFGFYFLKCLAALCQPYHTYILCDEVYRGLNANEISISDVYTYGISTSSLSKVFSLAGLRLGWIKAHKSVIDQINVRRDYSMISTGPLVDELGYLALKHKDVLLDRSRKIVEENRRIIDDWLFENHDFSVILPNSGTVAFLRYDFDMKSEELALRLLYDKGIFFVPGSCFDVENHMRLSLAQDSEMLKKGLQELSAWVELNVK